MSQPTSECPRVPAISHHRGGSEGVVPGSRAAYHQAVNNGAELIEVDVWRSADGVLICAHSARSGDGSRWDQLDSVHIGDDIPRLTEIVQLAGQTGLHVDLKATGCETEVVDLVLAAEPGVETLFFTSLQDESVRTIRRHYPHLNVALSLGRGTKGLGRIAATRSVLSEVFPFRRLRNCDANAVAANYWLYTPLLRWYCGRRSIGIMVWTVNSDRQLVRYTADQRLSVLITDRPAAATLIRDSPTKRSRFGRFRLPVRPFARLRRRRA